MTKINLYLHTYSLRFHLAHQEGFDVHAFIDRAAAEGFDGVSISANDSNYRHLKGIEDWRLTAIRERIQEYGLLCDLDTSHTEASHMIKMLGVAKAIGADKLRTYTKYDDTPAAMIKQTITDLKEVAPVAENLGITVMLENHESFTGGEIAEVLTVVDNPYIAALYDYGNSQMVLEDPLDCLEAMAPFSRSAHVKDHVALQAENSPDGKLSILGVPIGEGYLEIEETTKRLLQVGCNNIVFENSWGYRAPVRDSRKNEAGLALLGKGSFQFAEEPITSERYMVDWEQLAPHQLIEREHDAHERSLKWFRELLEKVEC